METNTYLEKLITRIAFVGVLLLPLIFVPSAAVSLYVAKVTFMATVAVVLFIAFLFTILKTGHVRIPRSKVVLSLIVLALVSIVSAFFTHVFGPSFSGVVLEQGSAVVLLILISLCILFAVAVTSYGVAKTILRAILYSSFVLAALLLIIILTSYGILPSGIAQILPAIPAGSVTDTGIVLGAAIILALTTLTMSNVGSKMRYALYATIIFAFLFIGAMNFSAVPAVLAVFVLLHFVYLLAYSQKSHINMDGSVSQGERKISPLSLFALAVSVILVIGASSIGPSLASLLRVNNVVVRPSASATFDLVEKSLAESPALGVGPNRFASLWDMHRPVEINVTDFWGTRFASGSGYIPTLVAETGILGLLAVLAFLGLYGLVGFKSIFAESGESNSDSKYLTLTAFLVSLYFWILLILYSPGIVVLALAFITSGLAIALAVNSGVVRSTNWNIFASPRSNFASVFSIVVLVVASAAAGYMVWEKSIAAVLYTKAVNTINTTGNVDQSRDYMVRAVSISPADEYWRGIAELTTLKVRADVQTLTNKGVDNITDTERASLQTVIGQAIESARQAINIDGQNYLNWLTLGGIYEVLAQNGVEGSLDLAKSSYAEAQKLAPSLPSIPLAYTRLAMINGDVATARVESDKALALKPNYTDAYYVRAQVEAAANNLQGAIQSVEAATLVDPNNAGLHFQLGLMKYNTNDFRGAAAAFERAVSLVADYANAKYFLGLSYDNLGRKPEALAQFEGLLTTNPDSVEVKFIVENLKAGRAALANAQPPVSSTPSREPEPPIEE